MAGEGLLRIIAGKYRGRRLRSNPGLVTRPMPDRVRETVFERLGRSIESARVADVFAGTGTVGLEGLSRGARSVVFFERNRRALELLEHNVRQLGTDDRVLCWRTDVLRTSFRPQGVEDFLPYDFVFLDPPYAMLTDARRAALFYRAIAKLARPDLTASGSLLVLRSPQGHSSGVPATWQSQWLVTQSGMTIEAYCKTGDA